MQKTDTEESMQYENFDSMLHALKIALNPADLITETQWKNWSHRLQKFPAAKHYVTDIAKQIKLPWPWTKEFETLDMYLGQPINKISKKLGLKYLRTIILCVVHAAYDRLPEMQSADSKAEPVNRTPFESSQAQKHNFTFDELKKTNDPISLLTDEIWYEWTQEVKLSTKRDVLISDLVDDIGLLFWQARWKNEKISEFTSLGLEEVRQIQVPGKSRTIVICIAKIALDAIAKHEITIAVSKDDKFEDFIETNNTELSNQYSVSVERKDDGQLTSGITKSEEKIREYYFYNDRAVIVEQLTDILSSRFANGFRLNSPIEMVRFRSFFEKDVGEALTLPDEELKSSIATCGITFNGKVYAVSAQTKERIKRLAEDYFSAGAQAIFFAEFYTKNESWLFEASVVSEDMLIEVLRKLFPKLSFKQTYLGYTDAPIFTVLEGEILRVWGDDVLCTYGQLAERLQYIPLERIKYALGQNGNFIWNSVETFSHVSKIEITDEVRQAICEAALQECNTRGYASIADLLFSEIAELNYRCSLTALHNAVYRICLSDKFDIKGKIVTRKGDTLDALTIMKNYCLTIEKCTLDDLLSYEKELTGEIHRWIPMEAGNTVLVRIDKDRYVADKFVHFDAEAVDAAIELFIEDDYLPLISFTTFGVFPHCGQTWNLFLLESYCRRFSRKFRFDTPSVNSRNAGTVIRKTCVMDYTEIMTDAVVNADVPLKDTTVGKFLYENGYTGRSTTAKVNEIIDKAKVIQKRKD